MYSLLPSLLELGDAVSRNLEFAYREDTRISFGEETITELNLLTLQQRHPGRVKIETFTKPKEVINGSDWEWMIIGDTWTYRARIQAKRIDRNGKLKGLLRKSKTATHNQMDALLKGAASEKIAALYCFYCTDAHRRVWKAPNDQYQTGCLLADAKQVKRLKTRSFIHVEPISVPWHFLFSSQRYEKHDVNLVSEEGLTSFSFLFPSMRPVGRFQKDHLAKAIFDSSSFDSPNNPLAHQGAPIGELLNRPYEETDLSKDFDNTTGIQRTSPDLIGMAFRSVREDEFTPNGVIAVDISGRGFFE